MSNLPAVHTPDMIKPLAHPENQQPFFFVALSLLFLSALLSYRRNSGKTLLWISGLLLQFTIPILALQIDQYSHEDLKSFSLLVIVQCFHGVTMLVYMFIDYRYGSTRLFSETAWLCGLWAFNVALVEALLYRDYGEKVRRDAVTRADVALISIQTLYHLLVASGLALVHILCSIAVCLESRGPASGPQGPSVDLEKCGPNQKAVSHP